MIIGNLVGSIIILHICSVIIIEALVALVELNYGAIVKMQVDCGVNLCVECDAEYTCKFSEQCFPEGILVVKTLKRSITMVAMYL